VSSCRSKPSADKKRSHLVIGGTERSSLDGRNYDFADNIEHFWENVKYEAAPYQTLFELCGLNRILILNFPAKTKKPQWGSF
jgi:hypothetical protein